MPPLADFTDAEKMAAEYAVLGIYPRGHLMQFVRPALHPQVRPCADIERMADGAPALIAGWPVARQHPKGRDGTTFVTIEDETGDAQAILWPDVHRRYRRELRQPGRGHKSGEVSRYDGTPNLTAWEVRALRSPREDAGSAHDWR